MTCVSSQTYELQNGMTALSLAAKYNHPDVVKILAESDVDLLMQVRICMSGR